MGTSGVGERNRGREEVGEEIGSQNKGDKNKGDGSVLDVKSDVIRGER